MKNKWLLIVLSVTLACLMTACQKAGDKEIAIGVKAPVFDVTDARTNKRISTADFKEKVIFLNFWASWCQPCKEEMPSIEALFREMAFDDSFVMITVLYNDSPQDALGYMNANGYTFPLHTDKDNESSRKFGVTGVPETYIIDKKGIIKNRVIGAADWNSEEMKGFIKTLLKE
ncbi:MAG: TlpA family protein disulfide reductase [Nitrospirae bacterium]|nr:TlpA family protein disulfide reductase [Nitrospirota bacterium]